MGDDAQTKRCPQCAEEIKARAQVCHYCGAHFDVVVHGRCPTCGQAWDSVDGRCPACGTDLVDVTVQSTPRPATPGPAMAGPVPGVPGPAPTAAGPAMADPSPAMAGPSPGMPGPAPPAYGTPTWGAGPAPVTSPAKAPRKGGCLTTLFWVVGVIALLVGLGALGLAKAADSSNETTYATELKELGGDLTKADAQAADVKARTDAVATAMKDHVASVDRINDTHEAITDTVNRSISASNAGNTAGAVAIATNDLPPKIEAFQQAVADQAVKQAALAAAVTKLQEVTP